MPTIYIPTALRPYADNHAQLTVDAATVREAVEKLTEAFPKLRQHLFREDGQLRSFVNLYLGDEDVRHLQGLDTPLAPDAELTIVPSVAGGALRCWTRSPLCAASSMTPACTPSASRKRRCCATAAT